MALTEDQVTEDMARLHRLLIERNAVAEVLRDYYRGKHRLPWIHKKAAPAYRTLMAQAPSNFPALIVDSVNDRLKVEGFRFSDDSADKDAWDCWQANDLDVFSPMVHSQALYSGYGYASVWPGETEDGYPSIKGESCFEVYHEATPGDIYDVRTAVKVWWSRPDMRWYGRYWKDGLYVSLEAPLEASTMRDERSKVNAPSWQLPGPEKWLVMESQDIADSPFIPFVNRPDLEGWGWGEFEDAIPLIDRINTISGQMLLAGELGAFKAKWATGIDIPTDDEGNETEPFNAAIDRLVVSENENAKFGVFDSTDLRMYQEALNQAITHLAAITRTPPFMLLGNLTNLSAEALKATESGLVKKAAQRQVSFGESWEEVMRIALGRTDEKSAETLWADPENVSESQHVDALSKLYAMGLPTEAVWESWGASPQQIERFKQMRSEDVMQRVMLASASQAPGLNNGPANAGQQQNGQPAQKGPQGGSPTAQLQQMPNDSGSGM